MLSANSEDDIDLSIKNKPFDFYLMKPFLHSELISIMQKLLNLSWRYQELENTNKRKNDITSDEIQPIILRKNYHESLIKLARAGDIRALQSKLKQIADEDPSSHSSVTRLQKELNNFNLESFKIILSEKGDHHDTQ